jgi:hypothetical protein
MRPPRFLVVVVVLALFYCPRSVSAQAYSFLGLSTGQTMRQVSAQLTKLGYPKLHCTKEVHAPPRFTCSAASSPDQHMQHMQFTFQGDVFTNLTFDFDPSYWTEILEAIIKENGRPTRPLSRAGRGTAVDWDDRTSCPCEGISLIRDGLHTSFMWVNAPLSLSISYQ